MLLLCRRLLLCPLALMEPLHHAVARRRRTIGGCLWRRTRVIVAAVPASACWLMHLTVCCDCYRYAADCTFVRDCLALRR